MKPISVNQYMIMRILRYCDAETLMEMRIFFPSLVKKEIKERIKRRTSWKHQIRSKKISNIGYMEYIYGIRNFELNVWINNPKDTWWVKYMYEYILKHDDYRNDWGSGGDKYKQFSNVKFYCSDSYCEYYYVQAYDREQDLVGYHEYYLSTIPRLNHYEKKKKEVENLWTCISSSFERLYDYIVYVEDYREWI